MRIFKIIYTIWSVIWLSITFLVCYPFMFLGALHPSVHRLTHIMNKVWGVLFFTSAFLFVKRVGVKKTDSAAVYTANHTSYLDIPLLFLTVPGFFMIIGKAELGRVPLFGFVFRRVYILVNRKDPKDRVLSYQKCVEAIEKGRSMVFFPEGTIPKAEIAPNLGSFKDGAFRLAIEKQVPLIPISMPFNWKIFPDHSSRLLTLKRPVAVFHDEITTLGMVEKDIDFLKNKVSHIIQKEVSEWNK